MEVERVSEEQVGDACKVKDRGLGELPLAGDGEIDEEINKDVDHNGVQEGEHKAPTCSWTCCGLHGSGHG